MKVVKPEEKVFNKKQLAVYIAIIAICIISIIIASYVQFYARIDFKRLLGFETENQFEQKSEEQKELLKSQFDQIFTNSIANEEGQDNKKEEADKPLVYTKVEKKENKSNSYDIDVHIPYINIKNEIVKKYNQEIEAFINKTENVLNSNNSNTIYTVEYAANIEYDILSVIIRSNLKEGSSAQRVIIETFNYDLRNNKEISLKEVLKINNLELNEVQSKINNEIDAEEKKVQALKELGYNIYSRDTKSDMYKIENTNNFYLIGDILYIIYAYGNEAHTSEMDLVII